MTFVAVGVSVVVLSRVVVALVSVIVVLGAHCPICFLCRDVASGVFILSTVVLLRRVVTFVLDA